MDIHIERVDDDALTEEWLEALERAEPAVLVRPLAGGEGRLLVGEGAVAGSLGDAALDSEASTRARARLRASLPESGTEWIGGVELFFEVNATPPHVVVFGAGSDAEPLVRYAWELGFAVTVVDVREALLNAARFPDAMLVPSHFSRFHELVRLTDRSFVVIMNHHLERDRESLRFALGSEAPYVGVLGPRTRLQKLLGALESEGFVADAVAMSRVRNPVGLALGAETPEEIAVSILGEMLALQRGFDGGFLAGRASSLHRRQIERGFRALVVIGRIDVEQQLRSELQDHRVVRMPLQHRPRAVFECGELRKVSTREQMRWCRHIAVTNADDPLGSRVVRPSKRP